MSKKSRTRRRISKDEGSEASTTKAQAAKVRAAGPSTLVTSAWDRLSMRTQHALCAVFLLAVALGFFASVTFGGKTLIGGDTIGWRGMAGAMIDYEETTGDQALWTPNAFAGMPGYLISYPNAVPQVDTLLSALRKAGWWPGSYFFVLLLGTYVCVYYLARDTLAATLAAVAFGLTTYIPLILAAGHNTKFVALAFAPWLLLSYAFVMRRPPGASWLRVALGGLLFAIVLAANLRAGHVQITYYVAFTLGVLWLVEGVRAVREGDGKAFATSTLALGIGGVLALVMVAQPYLVTAEYKAFTIRSAGAGGGLAWDYAMNWSQGFGELVTLLIPNAYGGASPTYWGLKPGTAGPHYLGVVVLMLAGLALWGVRRRIVWGLGIGSLLMTLFALGEHFGLLNRLMFNVFPLFDAFRVPETWLATVALALAILAGFGAYFLARREPTPEAQDRKTRAVYWTLGVTGGVLVVLFLGQSVLFPFERPNESAQIAAQAGVDVTNPQLVRYVAELKAERTEKFADDLFRTFLFFLLAGALFVLHRRRTIPSWALQISLVLLVLVDLWQVDRRYFNAESPSLRDRSDIEAQIPEYGFDRFIKARVEVAGGPGHFRTLPLALSPFTDGRTPYHYESIGGYHGAKLTLFQNYVDHVLMNPDGTLSSQGLDLLGTRYVIARGPMPGLQPVFQDEQTGLLVLENPDALPRAFFVGETRVVESDEAMWTALRNPATDLRKTALLAESLPEAIAPAPIDSASTVDVTLARFGPQEIVWQVETDRPRLFVANEIYYPAGWTASVGDEVVPIVQTDYLLRGVSVPAGRHIVTMSFEPKRHALGILLSTIGTAFVYLGALIVAGLLWYRKGEE